jgi:UDP-glucose 4-epimerase
MKILVTGGAGFIGSHVTDAFVRAGHSVTVVDDLSTGRRANLNPRARFVRADIRSGGLRALFRRSRFDLVDHHAAQIDVRRSVADPEHDADINIRGLLNLLRFSKETRVRKFVLAASGGTYYGECPRPAREGAVPRPLSPYGVSKLAGEAYVRTFGALFGMDFTVLRYGNVYGPRQDPHGEAGVVAIFSERMLRDEPVLVFGTGKQVRDYVYVGDVARANLAALRRGGGTAVNVGTGRAASVLDLIRVMRRLTGYARRPVFKPARPGELQRSCLDVAWAKRALGWRPETDLASGLAETVDFFRARLP